MASSENKGFTASDIERYHRGLMPEAERHALEKAALDDPFLADALEGYSFTKTASQDLETIKTRLKANYQKRRRLFVILPDWAKAAAVILVIGGSGWLAFSLFTPDKEQFTATEQSRQIKKAIEEATAPARNDSTTVYLQPPVSKGTVEKPTNDAETDQALQDQPTEEYYDETQQVSRGRRAPVIPLQDSISLNSQVRRMDPMNGRDVANRPEVRGFENGRNERNARPNLSESENLVYRQQPEGRVLQDKTEKLSNDSVNNFSAKLKGSPPTPDTIKNLNVVLEPKKIPVDEVVIASKKRNATAYRSFVNKDTANMPMPEEGFESFDEYVSTNLRSPEELKINPVTGNVELSFEVDRHGNPVNIRITKSLCEACDKEAIRLLKEGPKWKKKKNRHNKATITIQF